MSDRLSQSDALMPAPIAVSIVSHGQLALVASLLSDFDERGLFDIPIVVTLNIPEDETALAAFKRLNLIIVRNFEPLGFGENHNRAFDRVECDYFLVVNPDIRLHQLDSRSIIDLFAQSSVGAVAPRVLSPEGSIEDNARRFPTVSRLLKRVLFGLRGPDYECHGSPIEVDWGAGMFVAFRASAYRKIGGFDTRYFLYMEDADICRRLRSVGFVTLLQPATAVIHNAQRRSRRNLRYLAWHLGSAFRFLFLPEKTI